jgi:pyridoxal phosphate enzyme (YggS family)
VNLLREELAFGAMYRERLVESLPGVRDRIAEAAMAAGRDPSQVRLVAVTKGHPVEAAQAALDMGLRDLGENRVDELEEKVAVLGREVAVWHMIGHLQRRKAGKAVALAHMIHSVDTLRLGQRLSRLAAEAGTGVRALAQVNTSGEAAKSGFSGPSVVEEIHQLAELPHIEVGGLMTMAPFVEDEELLTLTFRRLRETLEAVRRVAPRIGNELSMGMTNDLEIAIREGSTMVRIGTALFGERIR